MNKNIRIDLFKLHDSNNNVNSWILCKGDHLESEISKKY